MIRKQLFRGFKQIIADRHLTVAVAALLLLTLLYVIYVTVAINPSELQVVSRYTAFGITNFYRDQWYYLFVFVGFGLVTLVLNTIITVKLLRIKGRSFGLVFAWLSVLIMLIAFLAARSILKLAALS
jgi:hypothetical protein